MKKILPLFSYLFHPLFVPVLGTLLYLFLNENYFVPEQKYLIVIQVSIVMVFIPICVFYLLYTLGKVNSVMLSEPSQRKIPLFLQSLLIVVLILKSITVTIIPELYYFFLAALISTVAAFTLLFAEIKASLHMIGMSALIAFTIGLSIHNQENALYIISFLIAMSGIVAASRLEMQAHTGKELLIGFLIGILPQCGLWYFWL